MPARPEAYSVGSPSASSAAFCASSSRSEATSSSRSWLSETTSAMRASGRSVLLTHQDHRQVRGQRLAQHEAGLRQRALGGVDQQHHAVDHGQAALHLATEVGVARGVDDVDHRHAAVGVLTVHGGVLRQDGDALFLLQVTGVHQAFDDVVTAVRAAHRTAAAWRRPGSSCHGRRARRWLRCENPGIIHAEIVAARVTIRENERAASGASVGQRRRSVSQQARKRARGRKVRKKEVLSQQTASVKMAVHRASRVHGCHHVRRRRQGRTIRALLIVFRRHSGTIWRTATDRCPARTVVTR